MTNMTSSIEYHEETHTLWCEDYVIRVIGEHNALSDMDDFYETTDPEEDKLYRAIDVLDWLGY